MRRRQFLRTAAVSSAALSPLAADTKKHGRETGFHFVVVSEIPGAPDRLVFAGCGEFEHGDVEGGGTFTHFLAGINAATGLPGPPPFRVAAHGTWEAKKFLNFTTFGQYGHIVSGILHVLVDLKPEGGPKVKGATLRVACNIPPAGIATGLPEGITLTLPTGTMFLPTTPPNGNTTFTPGDHDG